jgi:UDP-N-acetylmuramoyl-L-alanine---L-glutamate ligase
MSKIAILGFGQEGQALYKYFASKNYYIDIYDQKTIDPKENEHGNIYQGFEMQCEYSEVYKSPSLALRKITSKFQSITRPNSLINLIFSRLNMSKVISITGTKGKSTIANMTTQMLQRAGLKSELLGNIGNINIDIIDNPDPDCYYVFELSSYQTEFLDYSPHIGVFCSLFVDHQDIHQTFPNYANAKLNMVSHQGDNDIVICSKQFLDAIKTLNLLDTLKNRNIIIPNKDVDYGGIFVGEHNVSNSDLVFEIGTRLGIDKDVILESFREYTPLKGRLENIGTYKGITFFADDLASIPEATIAAIKSLEGQNLKTIIVGGYNKGRDYTDFSKFLAGTKIENFIYFEPTGIEIVSELDPAKVNIQKANNMQEAVELVYNYTKSGEVCLMSCASASCFLSESSISNSIFKSSTDRGDQYRNWAKKLGEEF